MLISRFLLSGSYLKNGAAYRVGQRIMASGTHSRCGSADSNKKLSVNTTGSEENAIQKKAIMVRVFKDDKGHLELSKEGLDLDKKSGGKLKRSLKLISGPMKLGDAFVVTEVGDYKAVALACVGPKNAGVNEVEALDVYKENLRIGAAGAYEALSLLREHVTLNPETPGDDGDYTQIGFDLRRWKPSDGFGTWRMDGEGRSMAAAQNWARILSRLPAKQVTPATVAEEAKIQLSKLDVEVKVHSKMDIEAKKMTGFLAVADGSSEPPLLLECDYVNSLGAPYVLIVAKGVTFDSGGLCLKKPHNLQYHGGMTGAAAALGALWGVAQLKVGVNVKLVIPLCANMISGHCLKVGDVVPTMKGLNVRVENTDMAGHLMLADALTYGQAERSGNYIMDVASLTPGIAKATGGSCYGCFTCNEDMWTIAREAGKVTGDRPWRFPVWGCYGQQIAGSTPHYDLKIGSTGIASHCTGAAFLQRFVSNPNWLHYDITGVGKMEPDTTPLYLNQHYMTGRPTRALIRAMMEMAKNPIPDNSGC